MSTVDVVVKFPRAHYLALVPIADKHGVQVHHLIEAQVARAIEKPSRPRQPRVRITTQILDQIRALHAEGARVEEIAQKLGLGQSTVYARMADLGLERHGHGRPKKKPKRTYSPELVEAQQEASEYLKRKRKINSAAEAADKEQAA